MAKISDKAPRSLKTFGVAGLLDEKCKVYYDSLFSARHIGRTSDLLVAKLKGVNPDDLRFRLILLYSLYEAYCAQLKATKNKIGEALQEPLTV
jgi:hypothetical protein